MQVSAVQQREQQRESQQRCGATALPGLKALPIAVSKTASVALTSAALTSLALTAGPWMVAPAWADSTDSLRRLLSSKACQGCDLRQAGLVFANLEEADLSQANLSQANLSQATLSNADLRGANLAGAVLYGANLYNADLTGADLRGADLRGAYLGGAKLDGDNLQGAVLQGAIAIPSALINAETYQTWATNEAQASRHEAAVGYYNKAIAQDNRLASAYLGRSFSVSVLGQLDQAVSDAETAKQLFEAEGDLEGSATAEQVLVAIDQAKIAAAEWEATPTSQRPANASRRSSGSRRNWGRTFTSLFKGLGNLVFKTIF